MHLRAHKTKLNNETYSIGIGKHIPDKSVNIAYVAAPEITDQNVTITNEVITVNPTDDETELYYPNSSENYALETGTKSSFIPNQNILITDEFSIKKNSNEVPKPLFYKATLKRKMKGTAHILSWAVPYQYGYSNKTEETIRTTSSSTDKSDIMPLVHILDIKTDDGIAVTEPLKIRMTKESGDIYQVVVYNDFNQDKVYRVTYKDYNGSIVTEVLESETLFTATTYDEFETKVSDPETYPEYWMATEYAIKQEGGMYKIYAPTQMMSITDSNRKPFEFKYRVLGNLKGDYNKSNPATLKIGMLFLNQEVSHDVHSVLTSFNDEVGKTFPEYVSFVNPHPPAKYIGVPGDHSGAQDYWDIDLSAPQSHINDFDIIFITGYGSHDLATYNSKLRDYLNDGGKLVIDNLSNTTSEFLSIDFGEDSPIVRYTLASPIVGERELGTAPGYGSRYYNLSDTTSVCYTTDTDVIGPRLNLVEENTADWTHIIKYKRDSSPYSIAVKSYNGRGKIILSNCGVLKGFLFDQIQAKYFMTNTILTLAEDIWLTTPWIFDRVYHKDQLYKQEYDLECYVSDISPLAGSQIVAKKVLSSKVQDALSYYTGVYGLTGTCHIEAYERNKNGDFISLTNVYMPSELKYNEQLFAFAKRAADTSFDINDVEGYEASNIHVDYAPVNFKVVISPMATIWTDNTVQIDDQNIGAGNSSSKTFQVPNFPMSSILNVKLSGVVQEYGQNYVANLDTGVLTFVTPPAAGAPVLISYKYKTGEIIQETIEAPSTNRSKIQFNVNKANGFATLGLLSTLIPQMPSGTSWVDKNNVYFKIEVSADEEIDGLFINPVENRINLYIYDKVTGKYVYASNGENIISYNDLYRWREIEKVDGGSIMRRACDDIILQASTNYYTLVANKRIYAVKSKTSTENVLSLPLGLNTNESWYPRVKYLNFIKKSFDKSDYDRISKTIGFRYDKDYIIAKAKEYFGEDPNGDLVGDIIAKLDNDEVVDIDDIMILAEAFDLIDENNSYEYDITEYFNQPWIDGYPYRKVSDEYAQYVNQNTIKVQNAPLNISYGIATGETLQQVAPTILKGHNQNWLPSLPILIEQKIGEGVYEAIAPDNVTNPYTIDYMNGLVVFASNPDVEIKASYNYSNVKVVRKVYSNFSANLEELTKLQERVYIAKGMLNKRILAVPNPTIIAKYTNGQTKALLPGTYTIDYDTGIITTAGPETGTLLMTYSYENIEYIELRDYNAKNGLLELQRNVHFNDTVCVDYVYEDKYYEYRGYYDDNLKRFMYLDMNPTYGHTCTYPVVVENEVKYSEVPTYNLLGKTVYLYMLPRKIVKEGRDSVTNGITIKHTFSKNELALLQVAHPEIIVLGSMKLLNNYTPYDVITLDTRKRGGGLKDTISNEKIEKIDEASLNLWDMSAFDGRSYHPNGMTIVRLPKSVLEKFSNEEVQEIVEKHLAFGVMPVIKYY